MTKMQQSSTRSLVYSVALIGLFAGGAFSLMLIRHHRQVFFDLCHFVEEHIFLSHEQIAGWSESCREKASVSFSFSRSHLVHAINNEFQWLGLSHLRVVMPQEANETWYPETIAQDKGPKFQLIDKDYGYLRLESFLPQYFEANSWRSLAQQIEPVSKLVIDLRQNQGGNFVAMLRVLSSFYCQPNERVGRLVQPKNKNQHPVVFEDQLEDLDQLAILEQSGNAWLKTFENYPCIKSKLVLLTDSETASVSEIFTLSLKKNRRALHVGERTAGSVLVGVWYPLKVLGRGYWLSLPEAFFEEIGSETLEGQGVDPDVVLSQFQEEQLKASLKDYF